MVELKPLFESAETLHREFSELTGPMLASAAGAAPAAAEPMPALKVVPSAVSAPPSNGAGEPPLTFNASSLDEVRSILGSRWEGLGK
jgi:hypothetical protein